MLRIKTGEINLTTFSDVSPRLQDCVHLEHERSDRDNTDKASVGNLVALSTRVEDWHGGPRCSGTWARRRGDRDGSCPCGWGNRGRGAFSCLGGRGAFGRG